MKGCMAGRIRSGSRAQSVSAVRSYLPCFFVHHACVTALLRSMTFGSRPCGRFNGLRRLPPLLFVHHACVTALLRSMTFGLRPCGRSMACGGYLPCFFVHHALRDSTASVDDLRFKRQGPAGRPKPSARIGERQGLSKSVAYKESMVMATIALTGSPSATSTSTGDTKSS